MLGAKVVKKKCIVINKKGNEGRDKQRKELNEQRKAVNRFSVLFATVIVLIICVSSAYGSRIKQIKDDISSKHNELRRVSSDIRNIKNVFNEWSQLQVQVQETSFDDVRSFVYNNLNLEEIVFEVDRKINDQFGISPQVKEKDKENRMKLGNFHIDVQPVTYANLLDLGNFISRIDIEKQTAIYVWSKNININFTASYERVVYQMIEFIKSVFPGFLIVKHISIRPATSAIKTMYYDLKFKHKDISELIVNSIRCEIEFDWVVLSNTQ